MRILKPLTIGAVLVLAQLSAFGAQIAILRNGFSIRFDHKEQTGNSTRLYTDTGYLDIASNQIQSFEVEETPVTPEPAAVPPPTAANQPLPVASETTLAAAASSPVPKATQAIDLDAG